MLFHHRRLSTLLVGLCLLATASAQWSTDPALNLSVGDRPGDQAVPKTAALSQGGVYVAWFDHAGSNYDVYLQLVDAHGFEAFPHNGLLVSSHPQSTSLVDWDLIVDSQDNAVLVFTDTRAGGDLDVSAYRISPSGQFLWGQDGVLLANDGAYEANPVVAEMTDGTFVCAWGRYPSSAVGRLVVQKIDGAGNLLFGPAGLEIFGGPTDDPGFVGIVPSQGGTFILSWIRDITPFTAPRHLYTQRFDAAGTALWGTGPLGVYDAAALPIAHKPELLSDGQGGAFHAWHVSVGAFFEGRVQHIDATGVEVFPHNGVEVSLEVGRSEFNPSMALLPGGELIVFYNKRNSAQSLWGVGGQRVSASGQLLWGPDGVELVPYDAVTEEAPRAVVCPGGAMGFVEQGNFATTLLGFKVDASGTSVWPGGLVTVASTVSPKDKLRAVAAGGGAVLVWNDARNDINDVYAQNVGLDGSLGVPTGQVLAYGCANPPNSLVLLSGAPNLGATFDLGVDDPTGTMTPFNTGTGLALSGAPAAGFPCGVLIPNTGLAAPGAPGELLVDLTTLAPLVPGPLWTGVGNPAAFSFTVPPLPALLSLTVHVQGALLELSTGRIGLTNGLSVTIGL